MDARALKLPVIACAFKEEKDGEARIVSFFAKQARGLMARFATVNRIEKREELKTFDLHGYRYNNALSSETDWVFTRPQPELKSAAAKTHEETQDREAQGMIDELIEAVADKSGLSDEQSHIGLAGALALMQKHADPAKVEELLTAIPGSRELAAEGAGMMQNRGLVGGLMSKAGGASGAAMADAMTINQTLARKGINVSDMQEILPVAMNVRAGEDRARICYARCLMSIPGLGPLLTGQGG